MINDTSNGWIKTTLGECAVLINETVSPVELGDTRYVGLEHIGENSLALLGHGSATDVTSAKSRFKTGDVLFGKLRPYFRKVVRAPFDGICSTDIWVFRPETEIDAGYLFYLMATQEVVDFATQGSIGTKMPRAKWDHVGRYPVKLPPLAEQRCIAHILGTLDDKIELNRRMNETLEEMARAVFKDWFVDFGPVRAKMEGREAYLPEEVWGLFPDRLVDSELGEVPEGWGMRVLDEIANVVYGASFASKRFNDDRQGVPLIRIRDLPTSDPSVFTDEVHPKGHMIEPGDIVVGMDGEFKAYYWLGEQAWLNQRVCHFEPLEGVPQVFLRESIAEPLALLERSKVGTTVIHLGKRDIDNFEIVVPPVDILKEFGRATDGLIDRIKANATESRSLTTKRDALLPGLVSGVKRLLSTTQTD